MRETQFIRQNEQKWSEFEEILAETSPEADRLHDMFVQVTDDLAHAQTFYPSRKVRAYLNGLAQNVFTQLYQRRRSPLKRLKYLLLEELPQVVYESRRDFTISVVLFLIAWMIGAFSSYMDTEFPKIVLGEDYVRMSIENAKSNDPMKVYKTSPNFDMAGYIMINNIFVTLRYFIMGIFTGIGSAAYMMYEGVRLGAFFEMFRQMGHWKEAQLTVWMHGALEISAIIIGTAAGITMGKGWLFPGTYTRFQSFKRASKRGITIMVGVTIMLIFAAIIEGFITRYTQLNDLARGLFILSCFASILFYYGWYPRYKAHKGFAQPLEDAPMTPDVTHLLDYSQIRNTGQVFGDTFMFFQKNLALYFKISAFCSILFCILMFAVNAKIANTLFNTETGQLIWIRIFAQWDVLLQFFQLPKAAYSLPVINAILYTILTTTIFRAILQGEPHVELKTLSQNIISIIQIFIINLMISLLNAQHGFIVFVIMGFGLPLFGLCQYSIYRENINLFSGFQRGFSQFFGRMGLVIPVQIMLAAFGGMVFTFLNSIILWTYYDIIGWNLNLAVTLKNKIAMWLSVGTGAFIIFFFLSLAITAVVIAYYTLIEINEANQLSQRIQKIGTTRKIRGLVRE
ncbi:MAG: hypothetical protein RIS64_1137 [Bacteroidota bacterium]|jgi:uncharacterized membrane protein SpoIIM required for sporulation